MSPACDVLWTVIMQYDNNHLKYQNAKYFVSNSVVFRRIEAVYFA